MQASQGFQPVNPMSHPSPILHRQKMTPQREDPDRNGRVSRANQSFHETWKLGDDGWTPLFTALRHTPSSSDHVVDGLRLLITLLQDNSTPVPQGSNFTNLENPFRESQHNHGALSEGVLHFEEHLLAGGRHRLCPLDRRIILLLIYELCNNIEVSDSL